MKYTSVVEIKAPREELIKVFMDIESAHKWQEGLRGYEQIEGTYGQVGSHLALTYEMNGRVVKMEEEIVKANLPHELSMIYTSGSVWNRCDNYFEETALGSRWRMDTHFKFSGLMAILAPFMRKKFKTQTKYDMESLKAHIEKRN